MLSATRSTDPDGDTLAFAWDFGDGSSASEPSPAHIYKTTGTYAVTLLAADGKGGAATAATRVVVMSSVDGNFPPLAVDNGPYVAHVNEDVTIDASGSTDPNRDTLAFEWTFGDGTSGSGPTVMHAYASPGTYTVRLLVTDGKGGASMRASTAVIAVTAPASKRPPIARAAAPARAFTGAPVAFSARGSSDPDGDTLRLTWVFDDGETAAGVRPTHIFSKLGRHTVTLIASDGHGGLATTSLNISIEREAHNHYPIANIGGPYAAIVRVPVAFNANASDEDGDEVTFTWDFGDGAKGTGSSPKHAYTKSGTFVATLLVSDDNGDVVISSTTVVISPPPGAANRQLAAGSGGPYTGQAGQAMTFEASASSGPDTNRLAYAWTFGDGTSGVGATVAHTYATPGAYTAMLLVTDGKGGSASALTTAMIVP